MRWVVVTPTFVAGLGIVVAAALAAPTRSVTLSTAPFEGSRCATAGCVPSGKGTLATGPKPKRIVIPARIPVPGTAQGQPVTGAGRNVLVQYRTLGQDQNGDFTGELILASRTSQPLGHWVLRFSYPGDIVAVWHRPPLPPGQHSVTVSSADYSSGSWGSWSDGHEVQIVFWVSGQPAAPSTCTVDGQTCRYATPPVPGSFSG
jgi:hypothetical protein